MLQHDVVTRRNRWPLQCLACRLSTATQKDSEQTDAHIRWSYLLHVRKLDYVTRRERKKSAHALCGAVAPFRQSDDRIESE